MCVCVCVCVCTQMLLCPGEKKNLFETALEGQPGSYTCYLYAIINMLFLVAFTHVTSDFFWLFGKVFGLLIKRLPWFQMPCNF